MRPSGQLNPSSTSTLKLSKSPFRAGCTIRCFNNLLRTQTKTFLKQLKGFFVEKTSVVRSAPRPEWSSFLLKRKKREWRTDKGAQNIKITLNFFDILTVTSFLFRKRQMFNTKKILLCPTLLSGFSQTKQKAEM